MNKEFGSIKITETDDGFQVEIKGKDLKAVLSKCCGGAMANCCQPPEEKKQQ